MNGPMIAVLVNGFPSRRGNNLKEGDQVVLIRHGEVPKAEELGSVIVARHTPDMQRHRIL